LLLDAQLLGTRCGIEAAGVELSNGSWVVSISGSWSVDSFFVEPKNPNGTLEPGNPWTQPAVGLQSWVNVSFVILCVSFSFESNFLSLLVQPQIAPWLVSSHEVWNWKVTLVKFACNPRACLKLSCEVLWVLTVCFSRTQNLPFLLLCDVVCDGQWWSFPDFWLACQGPAVNISNDTEVGRELPWKDSDRLWVLETRLYYTVLVLICFWILLTF
jgi:hypothetical protein